MRYALIRELDITNGEGVGVSLFVQGCHFHCPGCFNQETWDFNGGNEWTTMTKLEFLKLVDRPYIRRVSILGGEPLEACNLEDLIDLVRNIKEKFPEKKIWVYTGFTYEQLASPVIDEFYESSFSRMDFISMCDVLVDGRFQMAQQDIYHKQIRYAGSTNQRVIDIQESIKANKIVLLGGSAYA